MLVGKALAYAAMNKGRFVTWMPSYGAEVRGGTAHSMVVVSDSHIASPVVREPSVCAVMNKPSLQKFEGKVRKHGILIINKSLAEIKAKRDDIDILEIPATDMAFSLGDSRVGNMIILGALLARKRLFSVDFMMDVLKDVISKSRQDMIPLNKEAIKQGYEYGSR